MHLQDGVLNHMKKGQLVIKICVNMRKAIPTKYVSPELSVHVKTQHSEYLNDIEKYHVVLRASLAVQCLPKLTLLGTEILASRLSASRWHSGHYRER